MYSCVYSCARNTVISASEKTPGTATVAGVLSYIGKTIDVLRDGKRSQVIGWQGLRRERFGNGTSAMYVRMYGIDENDEDITRRWELIAQDNDGIHIPCLAAVALCRKLVDSDVVDPGARACVGLLSLDEYLKELEGLSIRVSPARVSDNASS